MVNFNPRSIRFRLTAWYAGILALTFACAATLVWLGIVHSIQATVDKELRGRLATVRGYIEEEAGGQGKTHLREELNEDAAVNVGSAYLRIFDKQGLPIYESPKAESWPGITTAMPLNSSGRFQTVSVAGSPIRLVTAPVSVGAVQIGLPMDEFREMQEDFLWTFAFGAPLLLLIAAAGGYWMSARALQPVDRIATAARRISSENLSDRLPYRGVGDELDRLSQTLNEVLTGLEESFRRVTQFTADASHELRTPLAIIRTTAELYRGRRRSSEEHERAWDSVLAQTERTTHLVDDLLTLTRADSGAGTLSFDTVDIAEVAGSAASEMHVIASSKSIRIQYQASERAVVHGDGEALRRVLVILIDNALKATHEGGSVEVKVEASQDPPPHAIVTVKDSGAGIAPEHLPYIFDRFYRASADRSRKTGGIGLGLAIAYWIVTEHNGTIQVDSQVGRGSTFRVILPLLITSPGLLTQSSESASNLKP